MSNDPIPPVDPNPEPSVPPQVLPPVTTPTEGTGISTTGLAPNVAAGLAALTGGLIGIVLLFVEKRDRFVRFWAMQSVFFGAAVLVLNIAVSIFLGILVHIIGPLVLIFSFFYGIVCLGILVLWIVMLIQAFSGKEWELPVLGKMARQQLARMPVV